MTARKFWNRWATAVLISAFTAEVGYWNDEVFCRWALWVTGYEPRHWRRFIILPLWLLLHVHVFFKVLWIEGADGRLNDQHSGAKVK